ncbi:hypothetical protein FRC08_016909 [Ceratobasidium sp. 394]|nr:hypothetical protein FRC08_016909 [Ceratobasidium sp. 394]
MEAQEVPIVDNGLGVPAGPPPRLFALIIGINNYLEVKKLNGAVQDAQAMSRYLCEYLDILGNQITQIYNENATRAAIVKAFRDLSEDKRIKTGDAILVFYAGHGGEAQSYDDRGETGPTTLGLVPYDVGRMDPTGNIVEILPDRTIVSLLDDIAVEKGDNITVIFDCCTSASGTPADYDPLSRFIGATNLPLSCSRTDEHLLGWPYKTNPASFSHNWLRPYVLLSACTATEVAWERDCRGTFTTALISTLKRVDVSKLSYTKLIDNLPKIPRQNPRCDGTNKTRVLFNGRLAGASPIMTRVVLVEGMIKLQAGFAQGVTKGARFGLHQYSFHESVSNPCLAILEVTASQKFYSALTANETFPKIRSPAYARQISPGQGYNIKVYISPKLHDKLKGDTTWQEQFLSDNSGSLARPTSNPAEADLTLDLGSDGGVTFDTHNKLCNKHGFSRLPETTHLNAKHLLSVLHSAAAWDWHVGRENPNPPFGNSVRIEMFRVKKDLVWKHNTGHSFIQDSENLNTGGVVNILADPSHLYGYRLVNDTTLDLFPYLFWFDASMLSIEHLYRCPAPATPEVNPIRSMQCLPISNGSSGTDPTAFFLESGQTLDMGIIKLFVTTRPVSFCPLEQESPFEEGGQSNTRKAVTRFMLTNAGLWDTQSLVVVQHETLPVPTTQPSNKVTASPPLNLNPRSDTPQMSSGALQMEHCPAYDLDKDGDALQPLQVDAPLREVDSFMTVEELIACLGNRGCADITDQLNLESCTAYPLFSGGFGDVYRGKTRDGVEVAIKTMRLYVTSEGGDKKRLIVSLTFTLHAGNILAIPARCPRTIYLVKV